MHKWESKELSSLKHNMTNQWGIFFHCIQNMCEQSIPIHFWLMLVRTFHSMLISWCSLLDWCNGHTWLMAIIMILIMLVLMSMMVTFSLWLWFGLLFWNYLRDWMLVSSCCLANFLKLNKCYMFFKFTNKLLGPLLLGYVSITFCM